ncbi:prepilin peptidase [Psychromicrobium lacuslunae]|uniref:Prepilin type IV endopeptidase peptidase domain-containing protein n=1 Tax=Psychromicrobium lacuslunae TaxID=1618207 RepID=A0A0D4BVQ6_9MICC|nr:prepilin peptidase [Psychromicrobium lacuslunae]AJT40409.1 hypothetical protein UM93_00495 [Psychromicrobium lacuslunae]
MIPRLCQLIVQYPLSFVLTALACAYLLVIAVWLSIIDLRSHLLPNRIVYPSIAVALGLLGCSALLAADAGTALRVLLGGVVLGLGYLLLRAIYPAGMGLGDVKLAVLLGCYLGYLSWLHLLYASILSFMLGGLVGVGLLLSRKGTLKTALPFGPLMFAGTILALLTPA